MSTPTPAAPSGKSTGAQHDRTLWVTDHQTGKDHFIKSGTQLELAAEVYERVRTGQDAWTKRAGETDGRGKRMENFDLQSINRIVADQTKSLLTANARLGQENKELRAAREALEKAAMDAENEMVDARTLILEGQPTDASMSLKASVAKLTRRINDSVNARAALRPADSPQVKEPSAPSSVPATPRSGEWKTP